MDVWDNAKWLKCFLWKGTTGCCRLRMLYNNCVMQDENWKGMRILCAQRVLPKRKCKDSHRLKYLSNNKAIISVAIQQSFCLLCPGLSQILGECWTLTWLLAARDLSDMWPSSLGRKFREGPTFKRLVLAAYIRPQLSPGKCGRFLLIKPTRIFTGHWSNRKKSLANQAFGIL